MAWHRPGDRPLSEWLLRLPTNIWVTNPQWGKWTHHPKYDLVFKASTSSHASTSNQVVLEWLVTERTRVQGPWRQAGVTWQAYAYVARGLHLGTFVYPFNYRSRNRHRNMWDRQSVSSWSPLYWFGYLHELYIDIWFTVKSLADGVCHLFYLYWPTVTAVAYGGLPFPGTGCLVPDVANIYLIWNV